MNLIMCSGLSFVWLKNAVHTCLINTYNLTNKIFFMIISLGFDQYMQSWYYKRSIGTNRIYFKSAKCVTAPQTDRGVFITFFKI